MNVRLHRGTKALEHLSAAWRVLESNLVGGSISPFQRVAWARAWMASLGHGSEPWILTAGDPLAALLPLAWTRRKGLRVVRFLGHGVSDYLGPLPLDAPPATFTAFGKMLRRESRSFDLLDLQSLHADEERRRALTAGLGLSFAERVYERCPVVDTSGDWAAYLASRKKKFRANLKRAERRVAEQGAVEIGREKATPFLFEEMVAVERDSWKWRAGNAFLRDDAHRRMLAAVLAHPQLASEVWTLRIDGTLGGFAVVFTESGVRSYYLPSFRERYPDTGTHLLAAVVRDSFEGPWREFDFLRGDESYKLAWSHREREVHQIVAAGRTVLGPLTLAAIRTRWQLAQSPRLHALRAAIMRRLTRNHRETGFDSTSQ